MDIIKSTLGLAPLKAFVAVPLLAVVHSCTFMLHKAYLIPAAQTTLLPQALHLSSTALPAPLDARSVAWACVFAGVVLNLATFYASLIHSALYEVNRRYDGMTGYDGAWLWGCCSEPHSSHTRREPTSAAHQAIRHRAAAVF